MRRIAKFLKNLFCGPEMPPPRYVAHEWGKPWVETTDIDNPKWHRVERIDSLWF